VGEIKYKYAILIGTPPGRDLLQALNIGGIFRVITGIKYVLIKCKLDSIF
jgi:hypothetical protein